MLGVPQPADLIELGPHVVLRHGSLIRHDPVDLRPQQNIHVSGTLDQGKMLILQQFIVERTLVVHTWVNSDRPMTDDGATEKGENWF